MSSTNRYTFSITRTVPWIFNDTDTEDNGTPMAGGSGPQSKAKSTKTPPRATPKSTIKPPPTTKTSRNSEDAFGLREQPRIPTKAMEIRPDEEPRRPESC
ncbi:uncharacterized protein RAG0_12250 [Rhynchosporium agropyri]|uniref:Uncharacterized protein n=1 Tax=Rhynchosporium agropyri TaxID=914238 RepID=A0A1E1L7P3_9HELO|nr:uncharacterized protein RAG0_12250 [Rhynchosporium agropyri]